MPIMLIIYLLQIICLLVSSSLPLLNAISEPSSSIKFNTKARWNDKSVILHKRRERSSDYDGDNLTYVLKKRVTGGGVEERLQLLPKSSEWSSPASKQRIKNVISLALGITIAHQLYFHRKHIQSSIPTKDQIQSYVLQIVSNIHEKGNVGIVYYVLLLTFSECVGLTTMPIEISGGMVYGFSTGLRLNAIGKVGGGMLAYTLGRTILYSKIKAYLLRQSATTSSTTTTTNSSSKLSLILDLLSNSIHHKTFTHSLLLRFSILPQLIKNLTLSVMDPVKWWIFLSVTCLHVLPYTVIWSALGHDSALRLQENHDIALPPNIILNITVLCVTIFGFVGVPVLTAWWIRQMRLLAGDLRSPLNK